MLSFMGYGEEDLAKIVIEYEKRKNNNSTLEHFLNKFKACLPIGYECILLEQNQNDEMCDWRRIRIFGKGNYYDISITPESLNLNFKDISDRLIIPIVKALEQKRETNFKMTREEAITKFHEIMYADDKLSITTHQLNRKWAEKAITAYEAIGLIKFDDVSDYKLDDRTLTIQSSQYPRDPVQVKVYKAIDALRDLGYKIEKL